MLKSDSIRLSIRHGLAQGILYPLCYYVVRYRRRVVRKALLTSFPDKSKADIVQIERRFYHHLADFLQTSLSGSYVKKERLGEFAQIVEADEVFDRTARTGGCIVALGHFLNWEEWLYYFCSLMQDKGVECFAVYKKQSSKVADKLMYKSRMAHGFGQMIEMHTLLRHMMANKEHPTERPPFYLLLADQRPRTHSKAVEGTLLHHSTRFLAGAEQLGVRFDYPVYYLRVEAGKLGRYQMHPVLLYDPVSEKGLPFGTITERFARALEENIVAQPEIWLWSHNRFSL